MNNRQQKRNDHHHLIDDDGDFTSSPNLMKSFTLSFVVPLVILYALSFFTASSSNSVLFSGNDDSNNVPFRPPIVSNSKPVDNHMDRKPLQNQKNVEKQLHTEKNSHVETQSSSSSKAHQPINNDTRRGTPERRIIDESLTLLREEYSKDPNDIYKILQLAEKLNERNLSTYDGGTTHQEAISLYQKTISLLLSQSSTIDATDNDANQEITKPIKNKSKHALLLHAYCQLGKQYYIGNMFEKAAESCSMALSYQSDYLEALNLRAMNNIVLGLFEEAKNDYRKVILLDEHRIFMDAFFGLSRVLPELRKGNNNSNNDDVDEVWNEMLQILNSIIPEYEENYQEVENSIKTAIPGSSQQKAYIQVYNRIAAALKYYHLVSFSYYDDVKHNVNHDLTKAFHHLTKANHYKTSILLLQKPLNQRLHEEQTRVQQVTTIFQPGFWPAGIGSALKTPIFIIGFPRCGSTLLERVLASHSQIVDNGEDSVFNGQLDSIRNAIIGAIGSDSIEILQHTVNQRAKNVVETAINKWKEIDRNTSSEGSESTKEPQRYTDKHLSNYFNVGLIHLLYPNAVIFHVIRNPMDTLFSTYKQDFPDGSFDLTSNFEGLATMYKNYRLIMAHWDNVLPGRIKHVLYEDLVNDLPTMAKKIINEVNLPWEDSVLDFHKQKFAVNTYSSTQVRKGIYRDSMNSWKRYEDELQPLLKLVGPPFMDHPYQTNL